MENRMTVVQKIQIRTTIGSGNPTVDTHSKEMKMGYWRENYTPVSTGHSNQ